MNKKLIPFSLFALSVLALISGCSSTKANSDLVVQIKSDSDTNRGAPFYVVVKTTNTPQFLMDDYSEIANQSLHASKDPNVLWSKVFLPGSTESLQIKLPEQAEAAAIYFLFTSPGAEWKYILEDPRGSKVKVLLGNNEIKSVNQFK